MTLVTPQQLAETHAHPREAVEMLKKTMKLSVGLSADETDPEVIAKAFNQPTSSTNGIQGYNLDPTARTLFPQMTPLRNKIARQGGGKNIQTEWVAITALNNGYVSPGIPESARGVVMGETTARFSANFRTIGADNIVSLQADLAAGDVFDLKTTASLNTLRWLMIQEEGAILGGRSPSNPLGATPTPTLAAVASGGSLSAGTLSVICVALSFDAYWAIGGWNNGFNGTAQNVSNAVIPGVVSKTTANGKTFTFGGGAAQKSANATVTVVANGSATAIVNNVSGAVAYAWFWGPAGSEALGAITPGRTVTITATATGSQLASSLPASDQSTNAYIFDGMISILANSNSGASVTPLSITTSGTGPTLTYSGGNSIKEIDALLLTMWNNVRTQPDILYMNVQQAMDINLKIISGGGKPVLSLVIDGQTPNNVAALLGGGMVATYVSPVNGKVISIRVHPNMPPGTILFWSDTVPYDLSTISDLVQIKTRRDYWQNNWPMTSNQYEYGTYSDECLQVFFPPAFALLQGIYPG